MVKHFILTMCHRSTLWFQLTGKSWHIIIIRLWQFWEFAKILSANFLGWTVLPNFSPSKILYCTVLSRVTSVRIKWDFYLTNVLCYSVGWVKWARKWSLMMHWAILLMMKMVHFCFSLSSLNVLSEILRQSNCYCSCAFKYRHRMITI